MLNETGVCRDNIRKWADRADQGDPESRFALRARSAILSPFLDKDQSGADFQRLRPLLKEGFSALVIQRQGAHLAHFPREVIGLLLGSTDTSPATLSQSRTSWRHKMSAWRSSSASLAHVNESLRLEEAGVPPGNHSRFT